MLAHGNQLCDPQTLIDQNHVTGVHAAAELRNDLAHPHFREGLSVQEFRQCRQRLIRVMISLTSLSHAEAGKQVSSSCDKPISRSAIQQVFQNMQVQWVMQVC